MTFFTRPLSFVHTRNSFHLRRFFLVRRTAILTSLRQFRPWEKQNKKIVKWLDGRHRNSAATKITWLRRHHDAQSVHNRRNISRGLHTTRCAHCVIFFRHPLRSSNLIRWAFKWDDCIRLVRVSGCVCVRGVWCAYICYLCNRKMARNPLCSIWSLT